MTQRRSGASAALLRARLTAQGLAGPALGRGADGPEAVAVRLLAIQAQDPRGARLAIRARTRDTTGAHVDRALTQRRSLVTTWLNRGTLHLVPADDYPLLQALVTPPLRTTVATRLGQTGVDAGTARRAVARIDRWLADDGPLSRGELRERLARVGVPVDGQAFAHLLVRASLDGVLVRGPMAADSREQLYARVADWLPGAGREVARVGADRGRALGELARRYLAGHGPADARDLARWAGIGLGDARRGLERIARSLCERGDGLVSLRDAITAGRLAPPRLLGAFEPVLMGWRSRAEVLGEHDGEVVSGGVFRAFAFAGGTAVGVWRLVGRRVELAPFEPLPASAQRALGRDGEAIVSFLGR